MTHVTQMQMQHQQSRDQEVDLLFNIGPEIYAGDLNYVTGCAGLTYEYIHEQVGTGYELNSEVQV